MSQVDDGVCWCGGEPPCPTKCPERHRMNDSEIIAKLAALFAVPAYNVSLKREGDVLVASISSDLAEEGQGPAFTFAQMMQLPAILGTERLDFGNESGHSSGSSWTGDYGHYNNLVIRATP